MTIPQFAPGCFGSALNYRETDMVCRRCPFAGECYSEHLLAMDRLRERLGIKVKKVQRAEIKPTPTATADAERLSLPARAQKLLERFDRGNFDIVAKLRRGENPFLASIPFMAVICHMIMRLEGPIAPKTLVAGLSRKLGWQENTATAHVRMAIHALRHVGAIDLIDDQVVMRK